MEPLTGHRHGRYELQAELGAGATATVFKAYDATMRRHVAVKVLKPAVAAIPEMRERFLAEARAAASLEHPNLVPVHDFGSEDGEAFLVMRYLGGGTLQSRLHSNSWLAEAELARLAREIGAALACTHEHGIVHRDVKPGNILMDEDGRFYLSDFGIARSEDGPSLTLCGMIVGTPAYMSPEQCRGMRAEPRSDLYSFGVVLCRAMTGEMPFEASTTGEYLEAHCLAPIRIPERNGRPLPESWQAFLRRALAKDPQDRFQSAADLVAAFEAAVEVPEPETDFPATIHEPDAEGSAESEGRRRDGEGSRGILSTTRRRLAAASVATTLLAAIAVPILRSSDGRDAWPPWEGTPHSSAGAIEPRPFVDGNGSSEYPDPIPAARLDARPERRALIIRARTRGERNIAESADAGLDEAVIPALSEKLLAAGWRLLPLQISPDTALWDWLAGSRQADLPVVLRSLGLPVPVDAEAVILVSAGRYEPQPTTAEERQRGPYWQSGSVILHAQVWRPRDGGCLPIAFRASSSQSGPNTRAVVHAAIEAGSRQFVEQVLSKIP